MKRIIINLIAFLVPIFFVGTLWSLSAIKDVMVPPPPAPVTGSPPDFKLQMKKRHAFILLGAQGTQVSEVLLSAATFSQDGSTQVVAVGPEKKALPLTGSLSVYPHLTFKEYLALDAGLLRRSLLVVPSLLDSANPQASGELFEFLKTALGKIDAVLLLGSGAQFPARLGLLQGAVVATYPLVLRDFKKEFSKTNWLSSPFERFHHPSGLKIYSSSGLAQTEMAALYTLNLMSPNPKPWPAPTQNHPILAGLSMADFSLLFLFAGYDWGRTNIGVFLQEGTRDRDLAAVLDTWPRALSARTVTIGNERVPTPSHSGLWLVPTLANRDTPALDQTITLTPSSEPRSYLGELHSVSQLKGSRLSNLISRVLGITGPESNFGPAYGDFRPIDWKLWARPLGVGLFFVFFVGILRKRWKRPTTPA